MGKVDPQNLKPAQKRKLMELPDEFTAQEHDWKAGRTFLDLLDAGLVDWKDKPLPHTQGDVRSGPGSHGSYRWHIRRTAAGRRAIGLPPLETKGE